MTNCSHFSCNLRRNKSVVHKFMHNEYAENHFSEICFKIKIIGANNFMCLSYFSDLVLTFFYKNTTELYKNFLMDIFKKDFQKSDKISWSFQQFLSKSFGIFIRKSEFREMHQLCFFFLSIAICKLNCTLYS